ncbi:MAG: helicase SNF2 [Lachnospiraceae bacterium]|nr:helicase SNF2 [Lachnospiraceae bacterium]
MPSASFILPATSEQTSEIIPFVPPAMLNDTIPGEVLDEFLRGGSNHRNGQMHIAVLYMENLDTETRIKLLADEFRTSGIGIRLDEKDYSIFFDSNGIQIAPGDYIYGTDINDRAFVTWQEADERISHLLQSGQYLPQVILDNTLDNERAEVALKLLYLYHDFNFENHEFTYFDRQLMSGGYPDQEARWAEMLKDPDELKNQFHILNTFCQDYEKDRSIMRFHFHRPTELLDRLGRLQGAQQSFRTIPGFHLEEHAKFITQDEIDSYLSGRGTDRKLDVYSFYLQHSDSKERADFLKNQFGTGGAMPALRNADFTDSNYDHKGLKLSVKAPNSPPYSVLLKWNQVASRVDLLLHEKRYLSAEELKKIPDYEIDQICRTIVSFAHCLPSSTKEERDPLLQVDLFNYWDAAKALRPVVQDKEQLSHLVSLMEKEYDALSGDDSKKQFCLERLTAAQEYRDGTFDLFPNQEQYNNILPAEKAEKQISHSPLSKKESKSKSDGQMSIMDFLENAPEEPTVTKEPVIQPVELSVETLQPLKLAAQGEYNDIKLHHPDHLVGFEQHGYYEFYGEDARIAAPVLGHKLLEKELVGGGTVSVTGFRSDEWAAHANKLWKNGKNVYLVGEQSDHTHVLTKELLAKDYVPVDMELNIDGRDFKVDSVDFQTGKVSLTDLTFFRAMGFPISRVESLEYVRSIVAEQDAPVIDAVEVSSEETVPSLEENTVEEPADIVQSVPVETEITAEPDTPVPHSPVNFSITSNELVTGGPKAKFRANVDAIRLLKELEASDRYATQEEQAVLSHYAGWGGIADAFDDTKTAWASEYRELKEILSPQEYEAARSSVLNAHYTSPVIIHAMYEALGNMGFSKGNILEPSCGIGNFFGCLPEEMSGSNLYGVELDSITGRIAKQLYQKANITIDGFEKTNFPDDFFDVVIGNVPFGNYQVPDRRYDRNHFQIHDYFIAKSLDQVRPGGVVAVITSSGTMDKQSTSTREYIAQRADLVGAIRLPNNAFKKNAGTDVVADILFLQKRDHAPIERPDWVDLDTTADGFTMNKYFVDHPEMILGTLAMESTQYGKDALTVNPIPDTDLSEQLHTAVQNIKGTVALAELSDTDLEDDISIPADPNVQNFSYTLVSDEVYYRENSIMNRMDLPMATANRIKGMIELRDTTRELLDMQLADASDEEIHAQMNKLNDQYDQFTKKYGLLNSQGNRRAFNQDASYCLLASLEILNDDGELERKADIFTKRTIKKPEPVTSVDTAVEALSVSMGEKACVDLPYMSELYGKPEDEICKELHGLIFQEPVTKQWQTADEYLSGNVREKLRTAKTFAENNPDYAVNVEFLKRVQPQELSATEIDVRLGVNWIEPSLINDFMFETFQTPRFYAYRKSVQVQYAEVTGEWSIKGKSVDYNNPVANVTFGTERASAYRLLEDSLNQRNTKIYDTVIDAQGNEKRVVNKEQTILAQQKQDAIKDAFKDWIFRDPARREMLVTRYNERFNSIRPREYDGSHLKFPGMNPQIALRPHQKNVVAHILYGNNCLAAHTVGSGKTFSCIAAAMESKRLGLCQKSLVVVPNHLTEQWGSDILKLYPNAKILVATQKDFEPANRKKFCSRIATGNYDMVVIGHTQFEKIPLSPERQKAIIQKQIDDVVDGIEMAKRENGEQFTIKQMVAMQKRLEARLDKLNNSKVKDNVVTFEQLGVDRLFVDESQEFKNLYCFTKMSNVAGISTTDAQKSSDMLAKCQYMDELTGGRGITFATGTPISNSMTELYTLMRYLQADTLRSLGLQHFDSWAAQFGETITAIELAPEGTGYRAKTRFAKFFNLPELMSVWKECADIQTADMLALPTPEAVYENILLKPSDIQKNLVASLAERAETIHNGGVDSSIDNMLKVTNDGRKLALDQRLINPMLPENPNSKANACVDKTFEIWEETADKKLTQVIFCDLSTPKSDGSFNVYDDIREKLVAKGVPREEIAFIHEANTDAKKANLFAKVRTGQVRVIIGSTSKMGAGTNIQDRLVALHHLDVPWRPSDVEQQEGRILRQGNMNDTVKIFRYLTEETFDAYMWQILENKQRFIGQVMTGKSPARSCEDTDETSLKFAEVKALASGNPLIMEKTELDTAVAKLKLLKSSHTSQHYRLEDALLKAYPKEIAEVTALIDGLKGDIETAKQNLPVDTEHFKMVIGGVEYTDRKEAGTAILAACSSLKTVNTGGTIGEYAGFTLKAQFDSFTQQFRLSVKGRTTHTIDVGPDPAGNVTRINNVVTGLEKNLAASEQKLESLHEKVESAKAELLRPFPQEEELALKQARLHEVNALLDMDEKGRESEPAQTSVSPQKTVSGNVIAVTPAQPIRSQAAYADQPKRMSILDRLNEKKAEIANRQKPVVPSAPKKEQTL